MKHQISTQEGLKAQYKLARGIAPGLNEPREFAPCKGNRHPFWGNEYVIYDALSGRQLRTTINPGRCPGLVYERLSA